MLNSTINQQICETLNSNNELQLNKMIDDNQDIINFVCKNGNTLLMWSIMKKYSSSTQKILGFNPSNINNVNIINETILHKAIKFMPSIIPQLLYNRDFTNINSINSEGLDIITYAYKVNKNCIVNILENENFLRNFDINLKHKAFINICKILEKYYDGSLMSDKILNLLLNGLNINKIDDENKLLIHYILESKYYIRDMIHFRLLNDTFTEWNYILNEKSLFSLCVENIKHYIGEFIFLNPKFTNYQITEKEMEIILKSKSYKIDTLRFIMIKNPEFYNSINILEIIFEKYPELFIDIINYENFNNINTIFSNGESILMKIIDNSKFKLSSTEICQIVSNIINNPKFTLISHQNNDKKTALMILTNIKNFYKNVYELLLSKDQDLSLTDKKDRSILYYLISILNFYCVQDLFFKTIEKNPDLDLNTTNFAEIINPGKKEIIEFYLNNLRFNNFSHGYGFNYIKISNSWPELIEKLELREPSYRIFRELISKDMLLWTPDDFNCLNDNFKNEQYARLISYLIVKYKNYKLVNYINPEGDTLLFIIVKNDWYISEIYCNPEINFTIKDANSKCILDYSSLMSVNILENIILHPNFNLWNWISQSGNTLLHKALKYCHTNVINEIIENPEFTNWNYENSKGQTILHKCFEHDFYEIAEEILKNPLFNKKDHKNNSGYSVYDLITTSHPKNESWDIVLSLIGDKLDESKTDESDYESKTDELDY